MNRFILSLLSLIVFSPSLIENAFANDRQKTLCIPGQDFTYADASKSHIVTPAYKLNPYIIYGLNAVEAIPSIVNVDSWENRGECTETEPEDVFVLTTDTYGARAFGNICADVPRINFLAYPRTTVHNRLRNFLESPLRNGTIFGGEYFDKVGAYRRHRYDFNFEEMEKLEPISMADVKIHEVLEVIQVQCGRLPDKIAFSVSMGVNEAQVLYTPEIMPIEATNSAEGWSFRFGNMQRAAELQAIGAAEHDDYWDPIEARLNKDRVVSQLVDREAGLKLLFYALIYGIGNSICNQPITKDNLGDKFVAGCDDVNYGAIPAGAWD